MVLLATAVVLKLLLVVQAVLISSCYNIGCRA
jgi:hypothetical protein